MPSDEIPSDTGAPLSIPEAFAVACGMRGPLHLRLTHRSSGATRAVALDQPYALLGRGQAVHVKLNDPSVSQYHAYLQVIDGRPYLVDLGSRTGVVWEDGSRGRGWLTPGHKVRVGAFDLVADGAVAASDPLAPPRPEPGEPEDGEPGAGATAVLEVFPAAGGAAGTFPLDQLLTFVGRHPSCQLRFAEDSVGYFHCALVNTRDGVWLVDVFSQKGTRLNGRAARLSRAREGDLIEIGRVNLVVRPAGGRGPLTLWGSAARPPAAEQPAALSRQMAESVTGALTPVREMMEQFQQCFVTMAGMFATQQQEHASLVCEQMRLIQDLARELRELRGEIKGGRAEESTSTPPTVARPAPRPAAAPGAPLPSVKAEGAAAQALADAHSWFLQQMTKLNQSAPSSGPSKG
ncbi:FHA domain-containing protein [Urbifossiella limnaea]|uniref:FHA domain protein n=1 Tax=Urbifossiella limnaea TaxID=2528023 RepID=A0A517Y374_9BACT|nr:FHA domain-containing protein [Urbifossiella limnaea]QDU24162.1 FHA domain protein [Urbifossiella limnaea]